MKGKENDVKYHMDKDLTEHMDLMFVYVRKVEDQNKGFKQELLVKYFLIVNVPEMCLTSKKHKFIRMNYVYLPFVSIFLLETKVISRYHQYRARPVSTSV